MCYIAPAHTQVDVKNCDGLPYELFKEAVYHSRSETTVYRGLILRELCLHFCDF